MILTISVCIQARLGPQLEAEVDSLTEQLVAAMQGEEERCPGCGEEAAGTVVLAAGHRYHAACFCCGECRAELVGEFYQRQGGGALCGACREGGLPRCTGCGAVIDGESVGGVGSESRYHPACFSCSACHAPLSAQFLLGEEGRLLCPACGGEERPPCAECGIPVRERALTALGRTLHPACFTCARCSAGLEGRSFTEEAGEAVCLVCLAAASPGCCRCGQGLMPVDGSVDIVSVVTCNDQKYHQECYRCLVMNIH